MTIELSLRRRATLAQWFAALWLCLAVVILVVTFFSLPLVADKTLASMSVIEKNAYPGSPAVGKDEPAEGKPSFMSLHVFALTTLVLAVSAVSFGSYLLGRAAFMQWEMAGRLCGIADALCIAGSDLGNLEKAASFLVPSSKFISSSRELSPEQLKDVLELVKKLR